MMVEFFGRNFSHRLQRAELKGHGMLRTDVGRLAELNRGLVFPFGGSIFARRSRSASASFAMARCMFSGRVISLSYCRHLRSPRLGMPVDHILDLLVDARGIREELVKAKSSNYIAHRCLADLIDRIVDVLNSNHRFFQIGNA